MSLWRCLRADLLKVRRTKVLWLHAVIPVLCAAFFILYFNGRTIEPSEMYTFYMETIAIALPLLLGIIAGLVVEQERQAGQFQALLGGPLSRSSGYLSKLLLLVLLVAVSILLAVVLWIAGMKWSLNVTDISYWSYIGGWIWLTGSSLLILMCQLMIAFVFGMGASILLGGAGLLLSALMATGLGDGIWVYVPWAWGGRFSALTGLLNHGIVPTEWMAYVRDELMQGMWISILLTSVGLIYSLVWFSRWEGRGAHE